MYGPFLFLLAGQKSDRSFKSDGMDNGLFCPNYISEMESTTKPKGTNEVVSSGLLVGFGPNHSPSNI